MSNEKTIQWGVLGLARIFKKRMLGAFESRYHHHSVAAISSRSFESAKAFATKNNISKAYAAYEDIINDDAIDAIYLPLPNSLHHEWIMKAADKGKHILCEKPIGYHSKRSSKMFALCKEKEVLLLESHSYFLHPQHIALTKLIENGTIGDIEQIQIYFSFPAGPEHAIRFDPALGGGSLLDLGCYGVDFMNRMFDEDYVSQSVVFSNKNQVDMEFLGTFKFPKEREVLIRTSFNQARQQTILMVGSKGTIFLPRAFIPPDDRAHIYITNGSGSMIKEIKSEDQYALLLDEFYKLYMDRNYNHSHYKRYVRNVFTLDQLLEAKGP